MQSQNKVCLTKSKLLAIKAHYTENVDIEVAPVELNNGVTVHCLRLAHLNSF